MYTNTKMQDILFGNIESGASRHLVCNVCMFNAIQGTNKLYYNYKQRNTQYKIVRAIIKYKIFFPIIARALNSYMKTANSKFA